jgi:hypothetical protein
MADVIGEAFVAIRPDLAGFSEALVASMLPQLAKIQAIIDAHPLHFDADVDMSKVTAEITAGSASALKEANAFANANPIRLRLDTTHIYAQLLALRTAIGATTGGVLGGGGGSGAITGAAAGAAAGAGGGKGGGLLGTLLWGTGGFAGFAAFGSIASLAGFGFEHVLTTLIGLVGSLAGAIGGLGVLAVGVFGRMAVGMGSDILVMLEANAAVKALVKGIETTPSSPKAVLALAALEAGSLTLAQATLLYGKAAAQAQYQTAQLTIATDLFWLHSISGALVEIAKLKDSILGVARTYIPLIAAAAQRNFALITVAVQPLLAWAKGFQATTIFKQLEDMFAQNIPIGVAAMTQFVELLAKVADWASQQSGAGFLNSILKFFTYLNTSAGFDKLTGVMATMIGMFRDWWALLKQITITIYDLFSQSVGLGTSIVTTITGMLVKLDAWLTSVSGKNAIHTLFAVHLQEVQALLAVLPTLLGAFGRLYLTIAPELTKIVVLMADTVGWLLKIPHVGPILAWAAAIALLTSRMGILTPVVGLLARATGLDAVAASAAATANVGLASAVRTLLGPLGLVAAGAAAFGAGLYTLLHNAQSTVKYMNGNVIPAFQAGANVFAAIGGGIRLAINQLGALLSWVETNGNKLGNFFFGLGQAIITGLVGGLKAAVNLAISAIDALITGVNKVTGAVPFAGREFIPIIPQWKDAGGPVSRGTPYFVGGLGPELFVPNISGTIRSAANSQSSGAPTQINYFYGVGKETIDLIRAELSANNRRFNRQLASM